MCFTKISGFDTYPYPGGCAGLHGCLVAVSINSNKRKSKRLSAHFGAVVVAVAQSFEGGGSGAEPGGIGKGIV